MTPLLALGLAIGRNAALRRPPGTRLPASPEAFRVTIADPPSRARIGGILEAFFTGFELGLRRPRLDPLAAGASLAPVFHPFFQEGRAMGIAARSSWTARAAAAFPARADALEGRPFLFLRYVGLGFWLGFRHPFRPRRVEAAARSLGKYGDLVLDGYGFKVGFFDCRRSLAPARRLLAPGRGGGGLSPEAARSAANGLGRSRWFFHAGGPAAAFEEARSFGPAAADVLGGLGLASAFTFPDEMERAYAAADSLDGEERRSFVKGIRIALYVRDADQPAFLEECLARLAAPAQARARADLARARRVGEATRPREDFIAAFHRGCREGS